MPIYEYACPKCRKVFSFFSKTLTPPRLPDCPKCGHKKLEKVISCFSAPRGSKEPAAAAPTDPNKPQLTPADEARMEHAMGEIEKDLDYVDENNPKHLAYVMKKMKDAMPPGVVPKEFDQAVKRLEKGESPEKIEEDMGDIFGMGDDAAGEEDGMGGYGGYAHDSGLYDY